MFCKQCGAEISETARFCEMCGCAVETQEAIQDIEAEIKEATENITIEASTENQIEREKEAQAEIVVTPLAAQTQGSDAIPDKMAEPKKENTFLRGFLSVLCCIMIFLFSFFALTAFVARRSISEKKVEALFENLDIREIMTVGDYEFFVDTKPEDAAEIFEKTPIKEYVTDLVVEYTEYLRGGGVPEGIIADDLVRLVGEYAFEIEEITGERIRPRDYREIQEFFGENGEKNLGVLSTSVRTNGLLKTIRVFLSIYGIIGLVILAAAFAFLMLRARKNRPDTLVWTSVPVLLAALTVTVFGAVKPLTLLALSGIDPVLSIAVEIVMDNILSTVLLGSAVGLVGGVGLIAAYIITKKVKKA